MLSLISAALITAIVSSFFEGKTGIAGMIRMIGGLYLCFVAINPLMDLDFSGLEDYLNSFSVEGSTISEYGKNMAREAEGNIITEKVASYIMDKAETLGSKLQVEVMLDQNHIPISVELDGKISPYAKAQLTGIIADDLGITKEYQIWIG